MADARREGHPRLHETSPVADDGAGAGQQRDTDCLTVKSGGHGLEQGICVHSNVNAEQMNECQGNTAQGGRNICFSASLLQALKNDDSAEAHRVAPMSCGAAIVDLHIFCNVATRSLLFAGSAGPLPVG